MRLGHDWPDIIETGRTVPEAIRHGSSAVAGASHRDDHLFPVAIVRGHRDLGLDGDPGGLLADWAPGSTRERGAVRYRWAITPRFAGTFPAWVGTSGEWRPWREADAAAWADDARRPLDDMERLVAPIILADTLDLLSEASRRADATGDLARSFLDEALPKARRDAAGWVQELRAWSDTWALWAMVRRPGVLTLLHPFVAAIADSYAASARRAGGHVLGTRFPWHGTALVSASAQLASGLVALGIHPNLSGELAARVRTAQQGDGGWGDGGHRPDALTTLVAAELLASLDPGYDPAPTAAWFARRQRPDGWWRACGPEASWLTVEVLAWLRRSTLPFGERFAWPHLAITNRDRRTGLPHFGYFSDLARLYQMMPGLSGAPIELAFIDLAGFGAFNNAFGQARGDDVLRTFAQALARIPGSMAIRDGGDEFIVLGAPTGTGLPARIVAFRESWAGEFAATFGQGLVAPRILTATTAGGRIVEARDDLGFRIADLKAEAHDVGRLGIQHDLGALG